MVIDVQKCNMSVSFVKSTMARKINLLHFLNKKILISVEKHHICLIQVYENGEYT